MTKARLNGLHLLLSGSVLFALLGTALAYTNPDSMEDFKASYYSARCLVHHCDPYKESEVLRIYCAEGGAPLATEGARHLATRYVYLPTAFSFTVPFAMLPWGPAHILWFALTTGGLILSSFLAWNLGAIYAPTLSGALVGFLLANSVVLALLGNPSGIAISLCVVAVWCFLQERFIPAGILCLAFSLLLKPQDAGFFWLYFLLAGGVYRKRALQTLLATVVLGLPIVLWVWRVAPNWMHELHSNMLDLFVPGSIDHPGPGASGVLGLVNLQQFISVFRDDSHIYNPVSYLVCASLVIAWAFVTLRSSPKPTRVCLALAAIAPLSLLPVYHHLYDTKLLLLTVPACAMLWVKGGLIGRLSLLVNTLGFVVTADLPGAILFGPNSRLHLSSTELSGKILTAALTWPVPLMLLAMGIFYLWVYARSCSVHAPLQSL
jgi:hypothetical protein